MAELAAPPAKPVRWRARAGEREVFVFAQLWAEAPTKAVAALGLDIDAIHLERVEQPAEDAA